MTARPREARQQPRAADASGPARDSELRRLDALRLPKGPHELRAFMVVRNEATRLPFVLQHHRALGVDRFFVVDNGSDDGTLDVLLGEPDVHVFVATGSYAGSALGMDWIHRLLAEHGVGRWVAVVDADEHLVFPGCESLDLRDYCRSVELAGFDAVSAMVVDMYPEGPIAKAAPGRATSLLKVCPFFDATGYLVTGVRNEMPAVHGGPRARLFWPELDLAAPARMLETLMERAWDDEMYLALHADVREARAEGVVRSGLDHFLRFGRFEGRPIGIRAVADWPEERYLEANPEVAAAIADGVIKSGLDHFLRFGQFEGRYPVADSSPCLTICPVVRWSAGKHFLTGRHVIRGVRFNTPHAFGAAVLHFKMLDDFAVRASDEARRGEHWMGGAEYQRYADVFAALPDLSAHFSGSARYAGSDQLVRLGYMREAFLDTGTGGADLRVGRWFRRLGHPA